MPLDRTTIIPLDDSDNANSLYKDLIESDKILMIILGDTETVREGVKRASQLASTSPTFEERWVIWIGDHLTLNEPLQQMLNDSGILGKETDYSQVKCFCLNKGVRKARTWVHKFGQLDFVRLELLYIEAEAAFEDEI